MALRLEDKKVIVSQVAHVAQQSVAAVAADYRGLSVQEMTQLRQQAREANVHVQVVRNTLAHRAVEGTEFECLRETFQGPLLLAFSQAELSAAARLIRDFIKDHEQLDVKALAVGGQLLAASQLDAIAKLPTREEAIATVLRAMKAPTTQFVRTLAEPTAKFVRVLAAVRDQKQTN